MGFFIQNRYKVGVAFKAIKYTYASSDSRTDSFQFAQLVKALVNGKPLPYNLEEVLKQLFSCQPFKIWESKSPVSTKAIQLYRDYVNEAKSLSSICQILAIPEAEAMENILWINYLNIKEATVNSFTKVCHGDLHTENFFKDDSDVYLIDFGYTDHRHAVIDHTTLEASLKFKHIPFYISIDELLQIELRLLESDTFQSGFDVSFIKRGILKEIFKLILYIRKDAGRMLKDNNNPIEYYMSLFFITFRQIQFADLNQRYALESATVLSNKIIEMLK